MSWGSLASALLGSLIGMLASFVAIPPIVIGLGLSDPFAAAVVGACIAEIATAGGAWLGWGVHQSAMR